MTKRIRSIHIVTRGGRDTWNLAEEIRDWLQGRGITATLTRNHCDPGKDGELPAPGSDLLLVLGGDGTMISIARRTGGSGVPLLGLNQGRVGFLTDLYAHTWQTKLDEILSKDLEVRHRLALDFSVFRSDKKVFSGRVVNDLVINRGILARLVNLDVAVNNESLGQVRADGLIMSTPTGSTAYGVSAGGPMLHPSLSAFSLTPICPFLKEFPPLALPGDSRLRVTVQQSSSDVFLTLDGQDGFALAPGDEVEVVRSKYDLLLARISGASYFSRLREKGFVSVPKGAKER